MGDEDNNYNDNEAALAPTTTNSDEGFPLSLFTLPSPSLSAYHSLLPPFVLTTPSSLLSCSLLSPPSPAAHYYLPPPFLLMSPSPLPYC